MHDALLSIVCLGRHVQKQQLSLPAGEYSDEGTHQRSGMSVMAEPKGLVGDTLQILYLS